MPWGDEMGRGRGPPATWGAARSRCAYVVNRQTQSLDVGLWEAEKGSRSSRVVWRTEMVNGRDSPCLAVKVVSV